MDTLTSHRNGYQHDKSHCLAVPDPYPRAKSNTGNVPDTSKQPSAVRSVRSHRKRGLRYHWQRKHYADSLHANRKGDADL